MLNSQTLQIKERVSIVEVISSYIKLEKAGTSYKARCPFHNEKSASFFVSPTRNSFHCFGCGKGGDIFTFVEEIEGIEFKDALKILADRAGIILAKTDIKERTKEEQLFLSLEESTKFFEQELHRNPSVLAYLQKRGLEEDTIKKFRIGYAKDGWRNLVEHLKGLKIGDDIVLDAGLSISHTKGNYDRFRGRIMFPICNGSGRVVAFTGRIFPENSEAVGGKYVNSPETILFNKSKILFGFDKAKQSINKEDCAILVEGQMDLIMAHQSGTENTVAVSGTALTEDQLKMIKRFTDKLLVIFDGDNAGFKAAGRGYKLALAIGMDVSFVSLPEGNDPADLILKDKNIWLESIKNKKNVVDFYIDELKKKNLDERDFMKEIRIEVLPYITEIKSSIDQAFFVKKISTLLGISENSVREDISKIAKDTSFILPKNENIEVVKLSQIDMILNKLLAFIIGESEVKSPPELIKEIKENYKRITGEDINDKINRLSENEKEGLIYEAENHFLKINKIKDEIENLIDYFEKEFFIEKNKEYKKEIKIIEESGDRDKLKEIFKKYDDNSKRIDYLINKTNSK